MQQLEDGRALLAEELHVLGEARRSFAPRWRRGALGLAPGVRAGAGAGGAFELHGSDDEGGGESEGV